MLKLLLSTALLLPVAATAQVQVTAYTASDGTKANDPDKIVCQKEEKIGTRLGGKKTCLTVREWETRKQADRMQAEEVQAGARAQSSFDPPPPPRIDSSPH